jgi:hypothetical protein
VDESNLTLLALVVGVALLYLGSVLRRRAQRRRSPPPPPGGPAGRGDA